MYSYLSHNQQTQASLKCMHAIPPGEHEKYGRWLVRPAWFPRQSDSLYWHSIPRKEKKKNSVYLQTFFAYLTDIVGLLLDP